jgi:hypothetical protein
MVDRRCGTRTNSRVHWVDGATSRHHRLHARGPRLLPRPERAGRLEHGRGERRRGTEQRWGWLRRRSARRRSAARRRRTLGRGWRRCQRRARRGQGRWTAGQWTAGQWTAGQWTAGQWTAGQWTAGQWTAGQWTARRWTTQLRCRLRGGDRIHPLPGARAQRVRVLQPPRQHGVMPEHLHGAHGEELLRAALAGRGRCGQRVRPHGQHRSIVRHARQHLRHLRLHSLIGPAQARIGAPRVTGD